MNGQDSPRNGLWREFGLPVILLSVVVPLLLTPWMTSDPRPSQPSRFDPRAVCDPIEGPSMFARFKWVSTVDLSNGGLDLDRTDIVGDGSLGSALERSYYSFDTRETSLGPGWSHNFHTRIRSDQNDLLFTRPNGLIERFQDGSSKERVKGTSRGDRILTRTPEGTMVVLDEETTWYFESDGTLSSFETEGQGLVWLAHDREALLEVVGPSGPTLRFAEADGRLLNVTNLQAPEQVVTYSYDAAGRVARVDLPYGSVERYTYEADTIRIATIRDRSDSILQAVTYDERGRVIRMQDADGLRDGQAVTVAYEQLPDGWLRTTMSHPESLVEPGWHPVEVAEHDDEGRIREFRHRPTSTDELIARYSWDADNRRVVELDPCR